MKRIFNLWLLLALTTLSYAAGRVWYSFNEGMAKARQENKPVVIDFYTDWCSWCKVMDQKTFSVPEVEEYLFTNFIPIRINAENQTEKVKFQNQTFTPRQLTSAFQITGFPSVAFVTAKEEVITVVPGYIEKKQFLKMLEYIHQECYKSDVSFDEFLKSGCQPKSSQPKVKSK